MPRGKMYDVIVVGAGPAGTVTAQRLAEKGWRVLLLERESLPRYKPCGGGLTGRAAALLPLELSLPIEDSITTAHFYHGSRGPLIYQSDKPFVYMLMRDRLDQTLVQWARSSGAVVLDGVAVQDIHTGPEGVTAVTSSGHFSGRFLVGADGASSIVARRIRGRIPVDHVAVAIELELETDTRIHSNHRERVTVDFGSVPWGYCWIFPKKNWLSVGVGAVRGTASRRELHDALHGFLERCEVAGSPRSTQGWYIPVGGSAPALGHQQVVLVGDAGGLADPFLGEGIYYAIRSGQIAADVLGETLKHGGDGLASYTKRVTAELYPQLRILEKISRLFYPHSAAAFNLLRRYPRALNFLIAGIAGQSDYDRLLRIFHTFMQAQTLTNRVDLQVLDS